MKKIYKVTIIETDACEGKTIYEKNRYIATENIADTVEGIKAEIEARPYWWMDHHQDADGRPEVKAEEITVEGL